MNSGSNAKLYTANTQNAMRIDSSGNVGIGTSSPSQKLHVEGAGNQFIFLNNSATNDGFYFIAGTGASSIQTNGGSNITLNLFTAGTERMRIDSSGNVGIGTSSPSYKLDVDVGAPSSSDQVLGRFSSQAGLRSIGYVWDDSQSTLGIATLTNHAMTFHINGNSNEKMRLDTSGNLLVGTTDANPGNNSGGSDVGIVLDNNGKVLATANSAEVMVLNRQSSDGDIAEFRKDGTTVGSIGTSSNTEITLAGLDAGVGLIDHALVPTQGDGLLYRNDNEVDLGRSDTRFKDLYLSGSIEIENGTGNVGVGKQALNSNTADSNTAVGYQAGYTNVSGRSNTFIGNDAGEISTSSFNTYIGKDAGKLITSGQKNTILGSYNGNQGGLDIRTSSSNIVLSDGDGNPRYHLNSSGSTNIYSTSTGIMSLISSYGAGTSQALLTGLYSATDITGSGGTVSLRVWTNGNIQNTNNSYTALSDQKLKENIVDANPQWDDIKALRVRNYNMIEGQTHRQIGLIAQEVETVSAGLVYDTSDYDTDGNDLGTVTKSVNYSVLYMKAVKALQEAMDRIETLEAKVTALENA